MSVLNHCVRRATVDDLPSLKRLWEKAHLPTVELEKRLTDFQLAEDPEGQIVSAVGLEIVAGQGRVHSATIFDENLHPLLWERVLTVARNHGLYRLWTSEKSEPWKQVGFQPAEAPELEKLPSAFRQKNDSWSVMTLKEESQPVLSLEQEFDLFKESQRELSEKALRQARVFKLLAWVLLFIALLLFFWLGAYIFRHLPRS